MSKPIGEETAAPIPYANIDGRRVAVLHGRVAKTPDGRIHEVVTPATMMRDVAPVTKCPGWSVVLRETQSTVHNEACVRQRAHNAEKLREALVAAQDLLARIDFDADSDLDDMAAPVVAKIGQALTAQPRNCDVGTPEEQLERLNGFCRAIKSCPECPIYHELSIGERVAGTREDCILRWGQLPYETEREGGEG